MKFVFIVNPNSGQGNGKKIAENIKTGELMDFEKFQKQAKRKWGNTEAYKEYEKRGNKNVIDNNLMDIDKNEAQTWYYIANKCAQTW